MNLLSCSRRLDLFDYNQSTVYYVTMPPFHVIIWDVFHPAFSCLQPFCMCHAVGKFRVVSTFFVTDNTGCWIIPQDKTSPVNYTGFPRDHIIEEGSSSTMGCQMNLDEWLESYTTSNSHPLVKDVGKIPPFLRAPTGVLIGHIPLHDLHKPTMGSQKICMHTDQAI